MKKKKRKLQLPKLQIPTRKPRTVGVAPGTLVFRGEQQMETPVVERTVYNQEEYRTRTILDNELNPKHPEGTILWYDLRVLHQVEIIERFGKAFGLHPLAMEDLLNTEERAKYEEYDGHIFLVAKALSFDADTLTLHTEQVSIFAGEGYVLTFQERVSDVFSGVRKRLEAAHGKVRTRKADYLAYALLDNITDYYYVVLDQVEEIVAELEYQITDDPDADRQVRTKIHYLRRQMQRMRKQLTPLREAIHIFNRSSHALIQESTELYLRDLYDHVVHVLDSVEQMRDALSGLQDLYLSEVSFRMNSVMQVLTIGATIFIPLSFLAGVYGMNFTHIPGTESPESFYYFWAACGLIAVVLLGYFWKKKWL